uniref:Uncharacterized protein n=1 Tax=Kalanchoe fedtschenkoi TaxID=63787 RepID=A0A7N0RD97_KALFE
MGESGTEADYGRGGSVLDWEEALSLYKNHVASGSETLIIRDTVKLAQLAKYAPDNVFACAVPILVQLFQQSPSSLVVNPSIHEAVVYCLICFLRKNDSLATLLVDLGAVLPVVRMLGNADGCFRKLLVKLLWYLLTFESKSRILLARNGGVQVVIDLLGVCRDGSKRYLLEILGMLALVREREVRRILNGFGGLQFLVEAARHGSMLSRERACQAIGLLGMATRGKRMLVELGVVPVLLELLRDGGQSVKLVAGNALGVISAHVDNIRPVAEAGAVPLYADLLRGPDPMGRDIAEDVFCILSVEEDIAIDIGDHLVRILREDNDEAKAAAADVLWDLAGYKHLSVVRSSGAIPIMVDLLRDGSTEVQEKVSGAFAQLSYNEADRKALAEAGAMPILINMLEDGNQEMKDNAAEALISFADDPVYVDIVSEISNAPAFQNMRNRIVQNQTSDEQIARSFRRLSAQHLSLDSNSA